MKYILIPLIFIIGCSSPPPVNDEVWQKTKDAVLIKGCEDWKKRDPKADC
jgi:hypothetical protein